MEEACDIYQVPCSLACVYTYDKIKCIYLLLDALANIIFPFSCILQQSSIMVAVYYGFPIQYETEDCQLSAMNSAFSNLNFIGVVHRF